MAKRTRASLARLLDRAEEVPGLLEALEPVLQSYVADAHKAEQRFDRFHWGDEASGVVVGEAPLVLPDEVLTVLGTLDRIDYETHKAGEHAIWYHNFESERPILAHTAAGKLVIVGGSYRVTARGIEG
jgi:hypothetical protein